MYVVYSKPMCPQCDTAITKLKIKGEQFEVRKLGSDYELEDLFVEIDKTSTPDFNPRSFPIIIKDGEIVVI
ncbi:Glutaredoxin [compost metagenome]